MGIEVLVLVQNAHGSSSGDCECHQDSPVIRCGSNQNAGHGKSFGCSALETDKYGGGHLQGGKHSCKWYTDLKDRCRWIYSVVNQFGTEFPLCVSYLLTQIAMTWCSLLLPITLILVQTYLHNMVNWSPTQLEKPINHLSRGINLASGWLVN